MYKEYSYLMAIQEFLENLEVGDERWFEVDCPKWGGRKAINAQRAGLSRVAKDLGIKITATLQVDTLLVKRLR